jgi:hypothetical protein
MTLDGKIHWKYWFGGFQTDNKDLIYNEDNEDSSLLTKALVSLLYCSKYKWMFLKLVDTEEHVTIGCWASIELSSLLALPSCSSHINKTKSPVSSSRPTDIILRSIFVSKSTNS